MGDSHEKPRWILTSPFAPCTEETAQCGQSVMPLGAQYATSEWHAGGFFLPGAEFEGWRFGLLQEHLHVSGLQAFVCSPGGIEATLVSDPNAQGIEQLAVPAEPPRYLGAFRIQLHLPLSSLGNVVSGFEAALPLIKQQLKSTPNA